MKIRTSSVHLTALCLLTYGGLAQNEPPQARIVSLTLDPQSVTVLHLQLGFVSSVRLPEEVSSVVLGDPRAFKGQHSETEPRLVFFKPASPKPGKSNALITTRSGRERTRNSWVHTAFRPGSTRMAGPAVPGGCNFGRH